MADLTDEELQTQLELLLDRPVLESEVATARRLYDAGTPVEKVAQALGPRVPQAGDDELQVRRYEPGGRNEAREVPAPSEEAER